MFVALIFTLLTLFAVIDEIVAVADEMVVAFRVAAVVVPVLTYLAWILEIVAVADEIAVAFRVAAVVVPVLTELDWILDIVNVEGVIDALLILLTKSWGVETSCSPITYCADAPLVLIVLPTSMLKEEMTLAAKMESAT